MNFAIQTSNPAFNYIRNRQDEYVRDAIETIFPSRTEYALMMWNHVAIPLSYKYDISVMYDDIVHLLHSLINTESNSYSVNWGSDTFQATWDISRSDEELEIRSQWISVMGSVESLLNRNPVVQISVNAFIAEWSGMLRLIAVAIRHAGYTETDLKDYENLKYIESRLSILGILYPSGDPGMSGRKEDAVH